MDGIFRNASWLSKGDTDGYGMWPIPNALDQKILELLDQWQSLPPNDRIAQASTVREDQRNILLAYSERMASYAVRTGEEDDLLHGLVALGIDGWRGDWRGNTLVLSLYCDACKRIGISTSSLISKASELIPLNVTNALSEFLKRNPEDMSIEAMGYEASSDENGFRYKRTW